MYDNIMALLYTLFVFCCSVEDVANSSMGKAIFATIIVNLCSGLLCAPRTFRIICIYWICAYSTLLIILNFDTYMTYLKAVATGCMLFFDWRDWSTHERNSHVDRFARLYARASMSYMDLRVINFILGSFLIHENMLPLLLKNRHF